MPYDKAECKCGHRRPPAAVMGRYAGLCAEEIEFRKLNPAAAIKKVEDRQEGDGITDEIKKINGAKKQLSTSAKQIVKSAEALEAAIEKRDKAQIDCRQSLKDLDVAIQETMRLVRAKIETHSITKRPD